MVSIAVATERDDVGLSVVDGNAHGDALPIIVKVGNVRSGESKARGIWCAYDPNGQFDPVLPAMLFVSLAFIGLRRREDDTV